VRRHGDSGATQIADDFNNKMEPENYPRLRADKSPRINRVVLAIVNTGDYL